MTTVSKSPSVRACLQEVGVAEQCMMYQSRVASGADIGEVQFKLLTDAREVSCNRSGFDVVAHVYGE